MFFKKKKISLKKLYPKLRFKNNLIINGIRPLKSAKKDELSFFDSLKYKEEAHLTKSQICITTQKLANFLPQKVNKIIVKNVLHELSQVIKKIYINADIDYPDETLCSIIVLEPM